MGRRRRAPWGPSSPDPLSVAPLTLLPSFRPDVIPSTTFFFDQEAAASYDERFAPLRPLIQALHIAIEAAFIHLPADSRVLCVGAGTGAEVLALGRKFPGWHFTAVEPSGAMLDLCRKKTREEGMEDRCSFHEGYLDTLPPGEPFHAATSILVSQFILDPEARRAFFQGIADRLLPDGLLVSTDLSADTAGGEYEGIMDLWIRMLDFTGMPPEKIARVRAAYGRDVAITPPAEIGKLIASAGFGTPLPFFQTVLIRSWLARRAEA